MRVLHVITRLSAGGAQANTLVTAALHRRAGIDAEVLHGGDAGDAEGDLIARAAVLGVPLHHLPHLVREPSPARDLAALLALTRFLRAHRFDLIHTHTSKAGFLGRLAARIAAAPAVVHTPHGHVFHSYYGPWRTRLYVSLERGAASWSTFLVALTLSERDEHLALGIGDPRQFAVVPSGIDRERFRALAGDRAAARARLGARPGEFAVGCLARLAPVKGQATLIRALPALVELCPEAAVHLLGDGAERGRLQALATTLGVAGQVRFHGRVEDPAAWIGGLDALAVPSLNEGMGRVVLEGMAGGVPIVASAVGGIRDLVTHRSTGLLVPPVDPAALAAALAWIHRNPGPARDMARAARDGVGVEMSAEAMAERLLEVYRAALGRAPSAVFTERVSASPGKPAGSGSRTR